jgi:hypothetical protein
MKNLKVLAVLACYIFAVSLLPGIAAQKHRPSITTVGRHSETIQLGNVGQFKEAFQNDAGKLRLVAIVSPT